MIHFRPFRNTDPAGLCEVWRASALGRGFAQPLSVELLERLVLSKPYFEREGLIVAEEEGRLLGFAHAGFGANEKHSGLSKRYGVTCLVLVRPDCRRRGVGKSLLEQAEAYLRRSGSEVLFAGPISPVNPFYLGLYGGSEMPGVLQSQPDGHALLRACGYQEFEHVVVMERDLSTYRPPIERKFQQIRRRTKTEIIVDPPARDWWDACSYGPFERIRFELRLKSDSSLLATASTWQLDTFSHTWGVRAVGLIDVSTPEPHRRQGHAALLICDALKHSQELGVSLVQVQTIQSNQVAIALYRKLGFEHVDQGTVYRKSAT